MESAAEPVADPPDDDEDARTRAVYRALGSPLRLRVLRLCAFDARTNKELAELLGVNPGTMLHHVRTLVQTGFLVAEEERAGAQGAREVPYRATGRSWGTYLPNQSTVLIETMNQQLQNVDPEDVHIAWLGLRLTDAHREELERRIYEIVTEFKDRGPDPDGEAYSLVTVFHPDLNPRAEGVPDAG
jgi:predicted ArsR family transcriptional regulator